MSKPKPNRSCRGLPSKAGRDSRAKEGDEAVRCSCRGNEAVPDSDRKDSQPSHQATASSPRQLRLRRRIIVISALAVLAVTLTIAFWPGDDEPKYKGHKISWWLGLSTPPDVMITNEQYRDAVQHIGTNAIPYLLKKMQYRQPEWRKKLLRTYLKLPRPLISVWLSERIYGPDLQWLCHRFPHWFIALGADGAPAIPELLKLLEQPNRQRDMKLLAMDWLRWIGEPARTALPHLLTLATNKDTQVASDARLAIRIIEGTNATSTAPE